MELLNLENYVHKDIDLKYLNDNTKLQYVIDSISPILREFLLKNN